MGEPDVMVELLRRLSCFALGWPSTSFNASVQLLMPRQRLEVVNIMANMVVVASEQQQIGSSISFFSVSFGEPLKAANKNRSGQLLNTFGISGALS